MKYKDSTFSLIFHLFFLYPARSFGVLFCQLSAGIMEGIGIATFIPLIGVLLEGQRQGSRIGEWISSGLRTFGLKPTLTILLFIIVLVFISKAALMFLASTQIGYAAAHVSNDLRLQLIDALMGVSWPYFTSTALGGLTNSLTIEAEFASDAYVTACRLSSSFIHVSIYLVAAFIVSWKFTFIAIMASSLGMFAGSKFIQMARRAGGVQVKLLSSVSSNLVDGLQGMKLLKATGRENRLKPLLKKETELMMAAQKVKIVSKFGLLNIYEALAILMIALVFYFVRNYIGADLSETAVMVLLFYRTAGNIKTLQEMYQKIAQSEKAYQSIRSRIEKAQSQKETFKGHKSPSLNQAIEYKNVSFSYGKKEVLSNVSVKIPRGKLITIIGMSGSGKTTFVDLLTGLIRPTQGDIYVDGVSLNDLNILEWRHLIGYVQQETILFHDTIANNITLRNPDFKKEAIEEVLKISDAWEFVQKLDNGINTIVGERGSKLSGGQRQRLSIARALITSPQLLILDEATSALDPTTEHEICKIIASLKDRVTIIAISHRQALGKYSDKVYSVEDGGLNSNMN